MSSTERRAQLAETERRVGCNIARLRKAKGMSQAAVGQSVGLSYQLISGIERGTIRVAAGYLPTFAAVLGASINDLFKDETATRPRRPQRSKVAAFMDEAGRIKARSSLAVLLRVARAFAVAK